MARLTTLLALIATLLWVASPRFAMVLAGVDAPGSPGDAPCSPGEVPAGEVEVEADGDEDPELDAGLHGDALAVGAAEVRRLVARSRAGGTTVVSCRQPAARGPPTTHA